MDAKKHQIIQTEVIKTVVLEAFSGDTTEDQLIRSNIQQLWRMSSAAAHGYYHHSLSRVEIPSAENSMVPAGMGLLSAKIDRDVGPLLLVSYLVLKRAIILYQLRYKNYSAGVARSDVLYLCNPAFLGTRSIYFCSVLKTE
ncbi:hypothetical protein [Corynebacterium crudilactis]|uniref:hypothetical protein n=1 Tax=Corynebacterium crudilactis TaxID=1652495 RepID=UPI0012FE4D4F|nr:hypothetical protein [Corynebacterium crudilactis]